MTGAPSYDRGVDRPRRGTAKTCGSGPEPCRDGVIRYLRLPRDGSLLERWSVLKLHSNLRFILRATLGGIRARSPHLGVEHH